MRNVPPATAPRLLAAAITVVLALGGCAATPVFRDGQALLPVLVAAGAAPEERAAATELGRVLGEMSGVVWPVRPAAHPGETGFRVGSPADPDAPLILAADFLAPKAGETGPDGFRIRARGGSIFIEGATPAATEFAVSWLLQHEGGVRWYAPGSSGEVIPRRARWSLPDLDVRREPAYVSREIYGADSPEAADWARRNGLCGRFEFSHALARVFTTENFATHPDWAPLVRGRRNPPESAGDYRWQPNLALPAVAGHAAQAARDAFSREPARASFSLGINDSVRFDQSAATQALVAPLRYFRGMPDYSPLVYTFMNRAAGSLTQTHPGGYLGGLAYFWCENVPPFPVHPQVLPYVTTDRAQYYDAAYRAADLALMSRWGASGVRAFGLWEYGYGQGFLVPRVPHRALAVAIREGWHRGARGYFADTGPQGGFDRFKVWMLAQLLWDPARTYEELADDFFPGFYGAAAPPMRRFFERCEAQWMGQSGPPYWLKLHQHEDQALLFPPGVCRELRAMLQQAGRLAKDDPAVAARVALTAQAFAVTEAYVEFDAIRRQLGAAGEHELAGDEAALTDTLRRYGEARTRLEHAIKAAHQGESPAMKHNGLATFVRNDPVPRLLWLAGRRDQSAPRRLLAGSGAEPDSAWQLFGDAACVDRLESAPNLATNASFHDPAPTSLKPAFLHPLSGELPAGWEVWAMPTETGRVALAPSIDGGERPLRIEGAWDTQVFQWQPASAGRAYLASVRLRGLSSLGGDAALFMTFLSEAGRVVGQPHMQALPKGLTSGWWPAVLADRAPADARWVGIGAGASRQVEGDWFEVVAMELRSTHVESGP